MDQKSRKKSLFSVFAIAALDNYGFGIAFILFAPLMLTPSYGMLPLDASVGFRNVMLGVLFAAFPIAQLIGAPIFGDYADRFGRKKALYLTVIGTTIGYFLSGIAIEFRSIWFLVFTRVITGFFAGNLSICLASIADLSPGEKERAKNFGIVTVVFGASWPFAMLVGGYLSDPSVYRLFSPELPLYVTGVLSLISLLLLAKLFTETRSGEEGVHFDFLKGFHNIKEALSLKAVRPYFFVLLFWTIGWGLSVQWYVAYGIQRFVVPQTEMALYLLFQSVFWTLGAYFINPYLLKRFSSRKTALITLFATTVLLILASIPWVLIFFSILYYFSAGTSSVSMSNSMHLISAHSPKEIQGKAMGLCQSMMSIGWFLVPILGGGLANISLYLFYPISALIIFVAFVILYFTHKNTADVEEETTSLSSEN